MSLRALVLSRVICLIFWLLIFILLYCSVCVSIYVFHYFIAFYIFIYTFIIKCEDYRLVQRLTCKMCWPIPDCTIGYGMPQGLWLLLILEHCFAHRHACCSTCTHTSFCSAIHFVSVCLTMFFCIRLVMALHQH